MPFQYLQAFGLQLRSEVPIPGAQPGKAEHTPDLVVSYDADGVAVLEEIAERTLAPYRLGRDWLIYNMPGVAQYGCRRDGRELHVVSEAGVPEETVAAYLIATALPAMLWLRGDTMLHAAAAVPSGGHAAVALAGESGSGKSTLLRRLLGQRAGAVADDCLALRPGSTGLPKASGLPGATQLASSTTGTRSFVAVPPYRQRSEAPLRHLIELQRNSPFTRPVRQRGPQAVALLLRNLHRPRVPRLLDHEAGLLQTLASLAGSLSLYAWSAEAALSCTPTELHQILRNLDPKEPKP